MTLTAESETTDFDPSKAVSTIVIATSEPLIRGLNNALLFAGKDKTIPALMNVRFDFEAPELRLVATDRYRLIVETVKSSQLHNAEQPNFAFSMRRDDCLALLSALKANKSTEVSMTYIVGSDNVAIRSGNWSSTYATDVDNQFPAWEQLLPKVGDEVSTNEIGFNPVFFSDFAKVKTPVSKPYIRVNLYGPRKPTRVEFEQGPLVLLMPHRMS